MKTFLFLVSFLILPVCSEAETADTIFLNGNVYTVNEAAPRAAAIAITGERILFVGGNEEAKEFSGPSTRTIDLKGKTVVPGLTDSHYHIMGVGERLTHLKPGERDQPKTLSRQDQRTGHTDGCGPLDHRPRLDRDFLEAADLSDSPGLGRGRA